MTIEAGDIFEVVAGIYRDVSEPDIVFANLGELIRERGIADTQETRIAVYGAMQKYASDLDLQLVIIVEEGVPSIADIAARG